MCFTAKCYTNAAFVAFVIKNQYWCVSRNKNGSDGGGRMSEVRCFAVLCSKLRANMSGCMWQLL